MLNTDPYPEPIQIQDFDDQNLKKITAENFVTFFLIKNVGLHKDIPATGKAFSPQKRTSSSSKYRNIFIFFGVIFALLDPDSESGSTDLIESDQIQT